MARSFEARLQALRLHASRELPALALVTLLGHLLASERTRPLAERWIGALERAEALERGTLLTTGLDPDERPLAARWALRRMAFPPMVGRRAPRGPWRPDWPEIRRTYTWLVGDLTAFQRHHPDATTPAWAAYLAQVQRERLHDPVPLDPAEVDDLLRVRTTTRARWMLARAAHLDEGNLRRQLSRLGRGPRL
jgi:hypothetical protein